MPEFCSCRAQLPPDARFCHKCGKPQSNDVHPDDFVEEQPVVAAVAVPLSVIEPPSLPLEINFHNGIAVRVGFLVALMAVLLVIFPLPFPFVRLLLAFVAAGYFSVYLYTRRTGQRLSLKSGARLGWITGIFSFTIFTFQLTAGVLLTSSEGGLAEALKSSLPANDARSQQVLQILQEPSAMAVMMVMVLFFLFVLLTVLPTLGGALGAKVLAREN